MTDRRKSPPLFDLMRERERAANAPDPITPTQRERPSASPSEPRVNPPAQTRPTAWDSSGGVSRAERSAAAMLDEAPQTEKTLKLPMSMAYLIVALMLAGLVGAWVGGYKLGEKSGKAQMESLVKDEPVVRPRDEERVQEPVIDRSMPTTPVLTTEDPILRDRIDPNAPGLAVMSASGFLADDPREEATNYLELATLPRDEASSAIKFMSEHGVPVIGIPRLDSRRSDANNPSRYTLYSLGVAAPGDQFRTMTRERDDHQRLIAKLGNQWQQEFRGGSDFAVSKTQWVKYTP
ncbi:MAG: hypothetical protein KC996_09490 [Phycisphaerales bacterium]|nr:hypothetical protein [Phycisphaerales bacterium]